MKALTVRQPWASLISLGVKSLETRSWSTDYRGPLLIHAGTTRPPMMNLPPLWSVGTTRAEQREANGKTWHVLDTITAPEHKRPHITDPDHPMRDHVPRWATSPTLFWPHAGPHAEIVNEEKGYARTMVLPLGAIVASCTLTDVVPITDDPDDYPDPIRLVEAVPNGTMLGLWEPGDDETPSRDISDQLPFGDFTPGRFAWIVDDVKPTTERCPACWGLGSVPRVSAKPAGPHRTPCPTCELAGSCEPVPARGHQGLWSWTP